MTTPVVLCGGSGTRLWPLSRKALPKQFVPLVGDKSLLQLTLERAAALNPAQPQAVCVASEDHRFFVQEAMDRAGVAGAIVLEPVARNTAAAMALAALRAEPDELLLFCPADHHIPDAQAFAAMVRAGEPAAEAGAIVTFGVTPALRRAYAAATRTSCRLARRLKRAECTLLELVATAFWHQRPSHLARWSAAFWPPKPKAFTSARRISPSRGVPRTMSSAPTSGSGSVRLSVA